MQKILVSIMILVSQVAFAGRLTNPCQRIFFDDYEKVLRTYKADLRTYRKLTGKEFGKDELKKSSAGSFTAALLCPLAAGFYIAAGQTNIAKPLLFCAGALGGGAMIDHAIDNSRYSTTSDTSEEKQKNIDEATLKITESLALVKAASAREIMLYDINYGNVFDAILENSEKLNGEKLDQSLLHQALATMRASKTAEFCPNNQPMSFAELTAELLKRYHSMGGKLNPIQSIEEN